jgi:Uma2 family endonuclease
MTTQIRLTHSDQGKELSLEEFLSADWEKGYKYELIEGRLEVSPAPGFPHSWLHVWLFKALDRYAEGHPGILNFVSFSTRVFVPGAGPRMTAPEPDIGGYRDFPLHLPAEEVDWRDVSPLLVVEIISPETAAKDLERNRRLYLRVPTISEYWMLDTRDDMNNPSLIILRRAGTRWGRQRVIAPGGTYTTPLLPGFSLVVNPRPGAA